jgi:hypothetical protein
MSATRRWSRHSRQHCCTRALAALLIFAVLGLALASLRAWLTMTARRHGTPQVPGTSAAVPAEPAGRRLLRIGFGLLWLCDGILQASPGCRLAFPRRSSSLPQRLPRTGCSRS